ncbi:MAG: divalent-cation tolerance protein CutA [Bacteroidota bacterium]
MYKNLRLVYITTKDVTQAKELGKQILEQRLAACINILPGMESMYWWEGQLETSTEAVLILKTHVSNVEAITKWVNTHHTYDCPCVISLPLSEGEGNPEYLEWLMNESKVKRPKRYE